MPSTARHRASGDASTWRSRSSRYTDPPLHSGSVGIGSLGAPGHDAPDHRVTTSASRMRSSARRTAWSNGHRSRGMSASMSCSCATTLLRRDSMRGWAMALGTGVTTFTHWLESHGVSTGTGTMMRRVSPATAA